MDQRTTFLIQVLERIGTPLAAAVTSVPAQQAQKVDDVVRQDAQRVAELLSRSVQLGLTLAEGMNVRDVEQADGVHLSLAALCGPLVAGHFLGTGGRIPGDQDIKRLSGTLQAVLTFADHFTPAADSTLRLENMNPGDQPADEHLVSVQMLQAFVPVMQVISEYAFGRPENKFLQEVSGRLMSRVRELREVIFGPGLNPKAASQAELVLLQLVCNIYATSHRSEMLRLMAMDDKARMSATVSPDGIWPLFDQRVEMVSLLAGIIVPTRDGQAAQGGGVSPAPAPVPNIERISVPEQKVEGNPVPPPSGNPMAFFSSKKAADGGGA